MLFVDRLLTESTLEAAIESNNQLLHTTPSSSEDMMSDCPSHKMDVDSGSLSRKLVLCRICHDEDEESSMEIPCSCCGSLKVCVVSFLTFESDHLGFAKLLMEIMVTL